MSTVSVILVFVLRYLREIHHLSILILVWKVNEEASSHREILWSQISFFGPKGIKFYVVQTFVFGCHRILVGAYFTIITKRTFLLEILVLKRDIPLQHVTLYKVGGFVPIARLLIGAAHSFFDLLVCSENVLAELLKSFLFNIIINAVLMSFGFFKLMIHLL